MSNFNFEGVHPLNANNTIALWSFTRDNSNGIAEWSRDHSRLVGIYKILEMIVKGNGKYVLKLQSTRVAYGTSNKPYYPKMKLTVNEKGQSSIMSCCSAPKYYTRYVIYNACI